MASLSDNERKMLQQVPMFQCLTEKALDSLIVRCPRINAKPHELICRTGEEARYFFVILRGHVRVFKLAANGQQQVLHLFGPGQSFAEAAVMKDMPYPAHAEAMDNAGVLAIDKDAFQDTLKANIQVVAGLVAGLSEKLKELAGLAERLSLQDVPARVALVLLEQKNATGRDSFDLPAAKKTIAGQIGTTPETLSRTLRKFREDGLIDMQGRHITIRDAAALRDLTESD